MRPANILIFSVPILDQAAEDWNRKTSVASSAGAVRNEAQPRWERDSIELPSCMSGPVCGQGPFVVWRLCCRPHPQSSPWQRWGRVWNRRGRGWCRRWRSRWRWRSSRPWTRPRRSSGVPTAGRRPSSTAAGTPATATTRVSRRTGQSTWSRAHSQVTAAPLSLQHVVLFAHYCCYCYLLFCRKESQSDKRHEENGRWTHCTPQTRIIQTVCSDILQAALLTADTCGDCWMNRQDPWLLCLTCMKINFGAHR